MVNPMFILLPLCSHVFTNVHSLTVNTTEDSPTEPTPVAARFRGEEVDYWTPWYNEDDPYGDSGDFETVNSITSSLGEEICPTTHYIGDAECRLVKSDDDRVPDILRRKCTTQGLICLNRDQPDGVCHDYKIRFLCNVNDDSGSSGDSGSRRRTMRFDMRIYILLAAVPVAIFVLRICWSCTFERRRRRQRRQLRAIRERHPENAIDPEAFRPPPTYEELFGENGGLFSLSRRYSLCPKCKSSQCPILRNRQPQETDSVTSESESSNPETSGETSDRHEDSSTSEVAEGPSNPEASSSNSESTDGATITEMVEASNPAVVDRTSSKSRSSRSSRNSRTSRNSRSSSSSEDTVSLDSARTSQTSCSSSDSEHQSRTNSPRVNPVPVSTSQCECPCHKNTTEVMSYDNPAYSPDVEFHGGRSSRLPGMHLSVFSLFRSPSESSTSEPPPPTYKEALKILKKNQDGTS